MANDRELSKSLGGIAVFAIVASMVGAITSSCQSPSASVEERSSELTAALSTAIKRCERLFPRGRRRNECIAQAERSCRGAGGSGAGGHAGGAGGHAGGGAGHDGGAAGARDAGAVDRAPAIDAGSPDVAGSGVCGADSPLDVWTSQTQAEHMRGISAVRPNDVWVNTQTQVQHWDGNRWTVLLNADAGEFFFGPIWAFGPNDAWLVSNRVRHWNGTSWNDVPFPVAIASAMLWGPAPNNLWIIDSENTPSGMYHWDGAAWTDRSLPAAADGSTLNVQGVWGATDDDVWAVGTRVVSGSSSFHLGIQHWNGLSWEVFDPPLGVDDSFGAVWGSAADDIWATSSGAMWHFDGGAWTQTQGGTGSAKIWGSCAQDVWAGSWHFDGTSWKSQFLAPNINIFAVSGTGPDDVWIGGALNDAADHGVLFHRHPGDPAAACGNFRVDPGERCDPPQANICDSTCQAIVICGNGVVDPGEQCDPPHSSPPLPYPGCDSNCQIPKCGNGILDPGEQCDPPQFSGLFPACDFNCRIVPCGNGVLDPGEQCDPPDGFTCDGACHTIAACGNGRIDPGEQCDPPRTGAPYPGCNSSCQIPTCGNLALDPGEQCDPPTPFTCDDGCQTIPPCGNGRIDPGEQCDPPRPAGTTPACSASCQIPTCGNLAIDPGEQCDPPRSGPPYPSCDTSCQIPTCGNLSIDPGEQCDPPNEVFGAAFCDSNCQAPTCGNGKIDPGEDCDPPDLVGWQPGHGSPNYCGFDCKTHNACTDCHQICDSSPLGFAACKAAMCMKGPFSPC
jgi:hypothetical protein